MVYLHKMTPCTCKFHIPSGVPTPVQILLVGLASNQEFITDLVCIGEAVLAQYSVLGAQPRLLVL